MVKSAYVPYWKRPAGKWNYKYYPWAQQSSYSGCDIIPVVYGMDATLQKPALFVLGNIQTLTYSIHRDKGAVRTLGRADPRGFTRGQRTIAGSIIFSVFDRKALWELSKNRTESEKRVAIADELPGFDIILYFTNEYGSESTLIINNIQIIDEGQAHSVEDMYVENTMGYIAGGINLLEPVSKSLPSSGKFINEARAEFNKPSGPNSIPYNYTYVKK